MSEDVLTKIDLIRHGEPVGGRRFRGSLDDPLSDEGWRQMRAAVAGHAPWQRIVTSPLARCQDFAAELGECLQRPVQIDARLGEIGFGRWEGREVAEIARETPKALDRFWQDPVRHPPPGGEPLARFEARVREAWSNLMQSPPGSHVLVVSHGGVIRMLLARCVLGMPLDRLWHLEVPYAAVSRIRVYHEGEMPRPVLAFHAGRLP